MLHEDTAQTGENDDPVEDEEDVIPTQSIRASGRVVVGDLEELLRMVTGRRVNGVG